MAALSLRACPSLRVSRNAANSAGFRHLRSLIALSLRCSASWSPHISVYSSICFGDRARRFLGECLFLQFRCCHSMR
jgi:hypothetical protein